MTKAAALRLYGANHKICVMLLQWGENEHKISEPNPFTKKNSGVAIQVNNWIFDEIGEYIYKIIFHRKNVKCFEYESRLSLYRFWQQECELVLLVN